MIEFVVSAQGLLIQNGMHAKTMTPAMKPLTVLTGTAHPPTFVDQAGEFGLFDEGAYPPSQPSATWVEGVYGMPTGMLFPRRRVNVIDRGSGIKIRVENTVVELEVRNRNGTRVERRRWAGTGDFDVNGSVQQADMDAFMSAYNSGSSRADFNQDGRVTQADLTAFTEAWEGSGSEPCTADLTLDDQIDVSDLLMYLDMWFPGLPGADLAPPAGEVDVFDLLEYLDAWFTGC